jgi:hypothetical protein
MQFPCCQRRIPDTANAADQVVNPTKPKAILDPQQVLKARCPGQPPT